MTHSRTTNNKYIFLDRDGTLVEDRGYVHKTEDLKFRPGTVAGLRKLRDVGYKFIIVTNQAGIAKGLYTKDIAEQFNTELVNRLSAKGIQIEKTYMCPHHPDFTGKCNCRKPGIGMVKIALEEFNINLKNSIFIGDKDCDIELGKNCGAKTILIKNPEYTATTKADHEVKDILEASELITS